MLSDDSGNIVSGVDFNADLEEIETVLDQEKAKRKVQNKQTRTNEATVKISRSELGEILYRMGWDPVDLSTLWRGLRSLRKKTIDAAADQPEASL